MKYRTNLKPLIGQLYLLLVALLMCEREAKALYVDPGSGTLVWQLGVAGMIGSLFYVRNMVSWIKQRFRSVNAGVLGFIAAGLYAIAGTFVTFVLVNRDPALPFLYVFLLGIVWTQYLFSRGPALFLLGISILVALWVFPPLGSFRVAQSADVFRIIAYTFVSIMIMWIMQRLRDRQPA